MLTPEQVAFWNANGYLLVKGLFTPDEAEAYRRECHDLAERLIEVRNIDATWGSARTLSEEAQKTSILHCHDVQFYSAAFSRMIWDDRLTGAAADLMGPNVQLHHTKMFIKPPEKGSPFPMHQDWPYFPHKKDSMIAAILHFDRSNIEKGCVRVVPGSHKLGRLDHGAEGGWHLTKERYSVEAAVPCETEGGDVLFFHYLTIHGSGINSSSEARTTILVQMRDPEDRPEVDVHKSWGQGQMLRGIDPTCQTGKAVWDGT
jgi:ectoine hydroxylase-related dioxygenase (phytanoyl-CoA dioxygenase family)